MRYLLDIKQNIRRLVPESIRNSHFLAWLYFVLSPLQQLAVAFHQKIREIEYYTHFNGQKMYLEKILNETLNSGTSIYIDDSAVFPDNYFYLESEQAPETYIYLESETPTLETYLFEEQEVINNHNDFIVFVPSALFTADNEKKIRAIVNRHAVAGKTYTIDVY